MWILSHLVNLLYPPACFRCHRRFRLASAVLCVSCKAAMPKNPADRCRSCGAACTRVLGMRPRCAACQRRKPAFTMACAPMPYVGAAREIIHAYKYQGRQRLGAWMAKRMAYAAVRDLPMDRVDRIVAVPSHWMRRCFRDIDASDALAKRLATRLHKPYAPTTLRRTRWTRSQTRLGARHRLRTVSGAFRADSTAVRGQRVLLVDDVLTSGATAQTCSQALRRAGAREVFVLTAARTPYHGQNALPRLQGP